MLGIKNKKKCKNKCECVVPSWLLSNDVYEMSKYKHTITYWLLYSPIIEVINIKSKIKSDQIIVHIFMEYKI